MKNTYHFIKPMLLLLTMSLLTSCSSLSDEEQLVADSPTNPNVSQRSVQIDEDAEAKPGHLNYRPMRLKNIDAVVIPSGSLFRADKAIGLYQPRNKYQIGDMILVKLDEQMTAQKRLNYTSEKTDSYTLSPVVLNAGSINIDGTKLNAEYDQEKDFDSSAQSRQSNSLVGNITVFVREFSHNGNLIVAGEKWMTLNKGKEYIRFSGEIRVEDIAKDNTISSVKVGNTQIEFTGQGELQDNQDVSFLGTLFGVLD
ncbi:MAG: flagellar basal body L-ring protein FlgH [Colwellia sp.]